MSVDPTQVQTTGPAVVTGPANIMPVGGLVGDAETALAARPTWLLIGLAAILAYLAALFAVLLVASLADNRTAQLDVHAIFTEAPAVWAGLAVVLLGVAYVAPSPVARK